MLETGRGHQSGVLDSLVVSTNELKQEKNKAYQALHGFSFLPPWMYSSLQWSVSTRNVGWTLFNQCNHSLNATFMKAVFHIIVLLH